MTCRRGRSRGRSSRGSITATTCRGHLVPPAHLQLVRHHHLSRLALDVLGGSLRLGDDVGIGLGADGTSKSLRLCREAPPDRVRGLEPAQLALGVRLHEGAEGDEGGADAPGGLPRLLVVARDGQADLAVGLEAARGGDEAERGRAERVRRREHYTAVVDALGVDRVRRALKGKVPLEQVRLDRRRCVVWGWRGRELLGFTDWGGFRVRLASRMVGCTVLLDPRERVGGGLACEAKTWP
ncbi:hypothetical protein PspLS_06179 [Pyricularia sp. CBS 133598]|nr:hypothetical protein PspLS_06179 [Pyricularia sp. CBS 133598]